MSDSKSPNSLLDIKPNRFYRARLRNIRWERNLVKIKSQEETMTPTGDTHTTNVNGSPNIGQISEIPKIDVKELEDRFNG